MCEGRAVGSGEEVELIEKVPDVDTAEGVHLGEGEDAGKCHFIFRSVWCVPGDIDDFVKFFWRLDWHRHTVVCGDNLEKILAEASFEKFGVLVKDDEEEVVHGLGLE